MDAFAVSVTSGFTIKRLHINNALKIAVFFDVSGNNACAGMGQGSVSGLYFRS